jgi:iron complex transport system substrate-binding protein
MITMRTFRSSTLSIYAACFLCLAGMFGCQSPNRSLIENAPLISKHFQDGLGRDVQLARKPKRIVSLAPAITEALFAIGAGSQVVGRSHKCDFPGEALDLPEVVIFPDFDLAKVAELDPDLVLASTDFHDTRIAPFFERYNIPLAFLNFKDLPSILGSITQIGEMVEAAAPAKALSDSLARIGKMFGDSTRGQIHYRTAMVISADPIVVVGGDSYLTRLLELAGATNVFADLSGQYPEITAEALLKAAPDYLLLPTRDDQTYAKLIEFHPEIHLNLPASVQKHIFQLEPELILRPGPRIMEGLAYLIRVLHARINVDAIMDGTATN